MKVLSFFSYFILFIACNNQDHISTKSENPDSGVINDTKDLIASIPLLIPIPKKLSVIVLPPYDEMANEGISPDIQEYLENEISKDSSVKLIKFPYKQLMGVPYYNVFDKLYCKPILEKIKVDIIVMSKIEQARRMGYIKTDEWNASIRFYNSNSDVQTNSSVSMDSLDDEGIKTLLNNKRAVLITEIKKEK